MYILGKKPGKGYFPKTHQFREITENLVIWISYTEWCGPAESTMLKISNLSQIVHSWWNSVFSSNCRKQYGDGDCINIHPWTIFSNRAITTSLETQAHTKLLPIPFFSHRNTSPCHLSFMFRLCYIDSSKSQFPSSLMASPNYLRSYTWQVNKIKDINYALTSVLGHQRPIFALTA